MQKVNRNVILSIILLAAITFSVIQIVRAGTPDPGHSWSGVGNGKFAVNDDTFASVRTFTFPDASSTVLTSNAAVTVSQGGTGAAPSADDQVLVSGSTSTATWQTVNDCQGSGKAITYTQGTNAWGCNTISGGSNVLLDGSSHTDTTAGAVARGDVITGQSATPKWTKLAKGTANQVLSMDGTATDIVWATPAGGGVPGGSTGEVQYNNAGAFAGAANVEIESGNLRLPVIATPSIPAANGLNLFSRSVGGRIMPVFMGPSGLDATLQPSIGRNKIAWWNPAGNSTTITAVGAAALTATGTATTATTATTSSYTRFKKVLEYLVTTAATTAVAGFRSGVAQYARGANAGDGGFHFVCAWGPATGVATTTNRAFVGMTSSTGAPTDVQPSSLTNMMGFGWDAADANIQFMHNDASGTATKVDMGATFPVPTLDRTKAYETIIFVAPNGTTIYYEITDLATGANVEGSVTTDLVPNTTLLAPRGWMSVGGTSSVIGIALMSLYMETDY